MPLCPRGKQMVKGKCLQKCKKNQSRSRITNRCRNKTTASKRRMTASKRRTTASKRKSTASKRKAPASKRRATASKDPPAIMKTNAKRHGSKSLKKVKGGYKDSRGWFYSSAEPWNQPIPPFKKR